MNELQLSQYYKETAATLANSASRVKESIEQLSRDPSAGPAMRMALDVQAKGLAAVIAEAWERLNARK